MNAPYLSPGIATSHLADTLASQRQAFLCDGPPTLNQRQADLLKLKTLILAKQGDIEMAL